MKLDYLIFNNKNTSLISQFDTGKREKYRKVKFESCAAHIE